MIRAASDLARGFVYFQRSTRIGAATTRASARKPRGFLSEHRDLNTQVASKTSVSVGSRSLCARDLADKTLDTGKRAQRR